MPPSDVTSTVTGSLWHEVQLVRTRQQLQSLAVVRATVACAHACGFWAERRPTPYPPGDQTLTISASESCALHTIHILRRRRFGYMRVKCVYDFVFNSLLARVATRLACVKTVIADSQM